MACQHNEPCSCPVRTVLARVDSSTVTAGSYTTPDHGAHRRHNRWRLFVVLEGSTAPTAGDVTVLGRLEDPDKVNTWHDCKLGEVAFDADGGTVGSEVAPLPRKLRARVDGYVGGVGQYLVLILETWREDLS